MMTVQEAPEDAEFIRAPSSYICHIEHPDHPGWPVCGQPRKVPKPRDRFDWWRPSAPVIEASGMRLCKHCARDHRPQRVSRRLMPERVKCWCGSTVQRPRGHLVTAECPGCELRQSWETWARDRPTVP